MLDALIGQGAGQHRIGGEGDRGGEGDNDGVVRLGRYELLHPLGIGGMAEVFKARAQGPGGFARDVVIKRILPAHGDDPEFIRMFVDEAKLLGLLHHPNIVDVYDFGEDDGVLFLALEYVEGPSLSRILRTLRACNRKTPPAIVAYVAREVCRALDHVHGLRDKEGRPLDAIHRDVTPSNVIVTAAGAVKLLDFGVSTFKDAVQITKTGTVKGKPAYLAPEQLEGKPIDGRVDLFALGIVMHEMLSLQHLFAGDSDLGTVKKIMEMQIPSPSDTRADVPGALGDIVMRALERDRDRRFASAAEMARALDDFLVGAKLHIDDVATFVRDITSATAHSAVAVAPGAVRHARPLGAAGARRQVKPARAPSGFMRRLRNTGRAVRARPRRALLMLAIVMAMLGAGTAFGLRATAAADQDEDVDVTWEPSKGSQTLPR
jgi:serine/threonine-protein kinase